MDEAEESGWSRAEWARWFLEHDEVDEAAMVLEPGDDLPVGATDFLDLRAALGRRGLDAAYEDGRAFVSARAGAPRSISGIETLGESARKAPQRTESGPVPTKVARSS